MYTLQVTADKLNIRNSPNADTDANWVGDMNNGAIFTAVKKVTGALVDGSNEWYVDDMNRFISAAWVAVPMQQYINDRFDGHTLTAPVDYNLLLNIDGGLKGKGGQGITIAVLDHAIKKDIAFKNEVIRPFNVDSPADEHGTFISGILAGISGVMGIAPSVQLMELPLYDKDGNLQTDDVIDALLDHLLAFQHPLIVNISQAGIPKKFSAKFAAMHNAVIVASAGTDNMLAANDLFFPASLPNVISVGAVNTGFAAGNNPVFNSALNFILHAFDYVSYSLDGGFETGTDTSSFATAVVSGMIALLYAEGKINGQKNDIVQQVLSMSQPYSDKSKHQLLNTLNPFK